MRWVWALALLAFWCAGGLAQAPSAEELKETRARIEALKKEIAQAESEQSVVADALKDSDLAVSNANRALASLGQAQRAAQTQLRELDRQGKTTESEIARQRRALAALARQRYVSQGGDTHILRQAFSAATPSEVARQMAYTSYVARAHAKLIAALQGNVSRLASLSEEAKNKTQELASIEAGQQAERATLVAQQSAGRQVLNTLASQLRTQQREVKTLEANEKRLSQLIERLAKLAAENAARKARRAAADASPPSGAASSRSSESPARQGSSGLRADELPTAEPSNGLFAKLKGKLRLPARGELVGRYGTKREGVEGSEGLSWKGLFIRADVGGEVKCVADGRVVFADWMRGFGNLLIVDHGSEYLSVYGYNEALFKQVGEAVSAGDTVAKIGASGGQAQPGLYFELRHQGKTFDPLAWVKR